MKAVGIAAAMLGLVALAGAAQPPAPTADAVELVLPENAGRIRIEPLIEGKSVDADWHAFLSDWFRFFDRDENGWLSQQEAARIFALPSAGGEVAFDFQRCDADKDGKVTLQELKQFYLNGSFRPVQALVEPCTLQDRQVAEAIFRHLGPDPAGSLTIDILAFADRLLLKLDENEDEFLSTAEVLSLGIDKTLRAPATSEIKCEPATKLPVLATIKLPPFNTKKPVLQAEINVKQSVQLLPAVNEKEQRIRCGNVVLAFAPAPDFSTLAVFNSRLFVLAQFQNAAGSKSWLERKQVANDPALQLLADIFPHADRDGDGKLTLKELESFMALMEQASTCAHVLTVSEHGRNLVHHIDANADGYLDEAELKAAARVLSAVAPGKHWKNSDIPMFARVSLSRRVSAERIGPLPLVASPQVPPSGKAAAKKKAPAWFLAMDLNGDGYVSRSEFIGPLELFQLLDANGDGRISVEEALTPR